MRELRTIQKREKLNRVYATDETGCGGANHEYNVMMEPANPADLGICCHLTFQNGPRKDPEARTGLVDQDLLEIVRDRLRGFLQGELATRETAFALTHVEEALLWLNKRIEDRIERGVLGTMKE